MAKRKIDPKILSVQEYRLRVISPIIALNPEDADFKQSFKKQVLQAALNCGKSERTINRWYEAY